eukprot:3204439-Pleurochrysis_carterae.AAC.1
MEKRVEFEIVEKCKLCGRRMQLRLFGLTERAPDSVASARARQSVCVHRARERRSHQSMTSQSASLMGAYETGSAPSSASKSALALRQSRCSSSARSTPSGCRNAKGSSETD